MKRVSKKSKNANYSSHSNERLRLTEYIYFRLLIFFTKIESWAPEFSAIGIVSMIQYFFISIVLNLLQFPLKTKLAIGMIILPIYAINVFIFSPKRVKVIESKFNNRKNINPRNETIKGWGILLLFVVSIILYAVSFEFNSSIDWSK